METKEDNRNYVSFVKNIGKRGYIIVQKSVYIKYVTNYVAIKYEAMAIDKFSPNKGNIYLMCQTVTNYKKIIAIRGQKPDIDAMINPLIWI